MSLIVYIPIENKTELYLEHETDRREYLYLTAAADRPVLPVRLHLARCVAQLGGIVSLQEDDDQL